MADLPSIVEIDGETLVRKSMDLCKLVPANKRSSLDSKESKHPVSAVKESFDPKHDSGYQSMSPHPSLEAQRSLQQSSLTTVPETDRIPIQCSDAVLVNLEKSDIMVPVSSEKITSSDISKLGTQFGGLSMGSMEDEGIGSIRESDMTDNSVIEVDLFDQDSDGDTLVHIAIINEISWLAITLIELAEDAGCLNLQNKLFQSPLHLAVLTEQTEVVKALIAKGADVALKDKQGNTALHIACRKDNIEMVRMIVESFGKDVDQRLKYFAVRNCEGLTCLHVASQLKLYNVMGYLFAKNADVNIKDVKSGRTVLHYAVERRDLETVILLLTHSDIDIECETYKGETPLVLAYWRNFQDIVKRLKSKGAFFSYDLVDEELDQENSS